MADDTQKPTKSEIRATQPNSSQLEYPQLLIEASFQSLLSHSQSSEPRATATMPPSDHALSESWSSLSEHDLIHDDDLTSEATDTGSLIDVSATEDIHSMDEDESSSDSEDDQDDGDDVVNGHTDTHGSDPIRDCRETQGSSRQYMNPYAYSTENIRLDDSSVVVDSRGITSLHASKTLHDSDTMSRSTRLDTDENLDDFMITIKMSMSPDSLKISQQPYNVLYHGSEFTSIEIKADILGKIGAALISSGENVTVDDGAESPCYHVIPSEFGPGSRPSTADLIPIPTQMHVTNCTVLGIVSGDPSPERIQLQLSNGRSVTSRQGSFWEASNDKQWTKPDLAIVVVSQGDGFKHRSQAEKVVEFANRHGIALLCLRQEDSIEEDSFLTDANPDMLHKIVQRPFEYHYGKAGQKMLLDVNMFRLLDTEQLSQHINYLTTSATRSITSSTPYGTFLARTISDVYRRLTKAIPRNMSQKAALHKEHLRSSNWIIETASPPASTNCERSTQSSKKANCWNAQEKYFVATAISRIATVFAATMLTVTTFYVCQFLLPRYGSGRLIGPGPSVGQANVARAPCMTTAMPPAASQSVSSQTFALSGPLQVIEQHVQSWVPVSKSGKGGKKQAVKTTEKANGVEKNEDAACLNITSSHISPSLKVETSFFRSGDPAFEVHVQRGDQKVDAKLERQADGVAAILVRRKDLYGRLTVHVQGQDGQVCALLDLEDSISEAFTYWIQHLHERSQKPRTAGKLAYKYRRLLEIRTTRPGLVNSALELHYSATQGLGAAVEAIEKSAIRHAKACQQDTTQCFGSQFQLTRDISESVQSARRMSEDLIQNTRDQVVSTTQQVKSRANAVTQHAIDEVSKAVQVAQSSFGELSVLGKMWPGKVSKTLTKAQQQAQELVRKSRSGRGKGLKLKKKL